MKLTTCSSCSAPIFFAETAAGAAMPIDAEPVRYGNLEIEQPADPRAPPLVHVLDAQGGRYVEGLDGGRVRHSPFLRYRSHFTSCPDASKHRKVKA